MSSNDLQKFLDELRAKISIADIVGDKVKLMRKGREYTGLCPFHNEKTPSFTVNEAKGFYHCFGCGAHGDIVKFEMDANNLPFMDAVEKLASRAGLEVPRLSHENKEEVEKKNSLYDIMEMAVKFYEKNLRLVGGQTALDYLYKRGFDDEIISKFRLGYAPNSNGLRALLSSKGVDDADMADLGLINIPEDKNRRVFDFFRDRVIIPIFDKRGRPIAFGGRIMGDGQPKYLNSPETPIFNKRRILYNMHYARDKAFEARRLIVCEGYMDVIALDKYGFNYAVAPLGTALTEDQITEAWKVCSEPTLCFDGDNAGIRAAMRSVDRAVPILKAGYSLKYAFLPDKLDPDEFLKARGHDEFEKVLLDTKPLADILWRKNIEEKEYSTPEQKALIEKTVLEEVAKIEDETVRGYYAQEMQNHIYYELGKGSWKSKKFVPNGKNKSENKPLIARPKINLDEHIVKSIIASMIFYPELIAEYEEKLATFDVANEKLRALLNEMLDIFHDNENLDAIKMMQLLNDNGWSKDVEKLWELEMLKQQTPFVTKIREEIDTKIIEVQLKQIDTEIKECLRIIEISESFPDEVYKRYEFYKKEKDSLLNSLIIN